MAEALGYAAHLCHSRAAGPGCFDVFLMGHSQRFEGGLFPAAYRSPPVPLAAHANHPLQSKRVRALIPDLRRTLREKLPEYMVPSVFVVLEAFPLSPNGKINRRALPEPDSARPDLEEPFVAPRSPVERVVAGIWADVLDLDEVGIDDGFIDLGGSSLLATQVAARLQEIFSMEMPLGDVYRLTVSDLAAQLSEAGRNGGVGVAGIAEAWLQVSELSESDVQDLLSSGKSVP
jgi:acyl carrier protein